LAATGDAAAGVIETAVCTRKTQRMMTDGGDKT
jgi:hypothetical protein